MQNKFELIVNAIKSDGFIVLSDFVSTETQKEILHQLNSISSSNFKTAGIGKSERFQVNPDIRSDQIFWIEENQALPKEYIENMESLRLALNQKLFLGLFDFECHFALYPEGAFYRKHLDAFKGVGLRVLSSILYLNPEWKPGDGGELLLYSMNDNSVIETITPTFGKQVFFLSENFPHEVLESKAPRKSLTGWFRIRN